MKSIQYIAFGGPEVLQLNEVQKPTDLGEEAVLIKIQAVTVNPFDIKIRSGSMQAFMPIQLPFIPGTDFSGTIESIGKNVTRLQAGDLVYGTCFGGSYSEYLVLDNNQVAKKPEGISAIEAAALAVPLSTSYSLLIEVANLQPGQKILILGASGAVGSVMVQMAKAMGAYVIGTASGKGVERVKQLGAAEVIDYKTQNFANGSKDVDLVADLVGGELQEKSFNCLKKGGRLISAVSAPSKELAKEYEVAVSFLNSLPSYKKLAFSNEWVTDGHIKAQVANILKLEQAAQAQEAVSKGGVNGKIVLEID